MDTHYFRNTSERVPRPTAVTPSPRARNTVITLTAVRRADDVADEPQHEATPMPAFESTNYYTYRHDATPPPHIQDFADTDSIGTTTRDNDIGTTACRINSTRSLSQ